MDEHEKYIALIREQYEVIMKKIYTGEFDPAITFLALLKINNHHWMDVNRSDVETIILATAMTLNVSYENIISRKNDPDTIIARRIAIYFIRKVLGLSHRKIAVIFKYNDHTTIAYNLRIAEKMILTDPDFCKKIEDTKEILYVMKCDWIL